LILLLFSCSFLASRPVFQRTIQISIAHSPESGAPHCEHLANGNRPKSILRPIVLADQILAPRKSADPGDSKFPQGYLRDVASDSRINAKSSGKLPITGKMIEDFCLVHVGGQEFCKSVRVCDADLFMFVI
jgi:hypothetical protein